MHHKGLGGRGESTPMLHKDTKDASPVGPVEPGLDTDRTGEVAQEIRRLEKMAVKFGRRLEKETETYVE